MLRTRLAPLVLVATAAALGGCGSDSDNTTASSTTAAAPAASTPSTAASAPSAGASSSGPVDIVAKDFSFSEKAVTRPAGKVTFDLANMGMAEHELVLLKTDADPASLEVDGQGRVDEQDSVGEIEEIKGGAKGTHTFDLKPGKYVFVCNIPGHYTDGMRGSLTVR